MCGRLGSSCLCYLVSLNPLICYVNVHILFIHLPLLEIGELLACWAQDRVGGRDVLLAVWADPLAS